VVAFVVDNSVVLSWFYPRQATEYTERLLTLSDSAQVHAAFIWPAEITNAALTLVKRRLIKETDADALLDSVFSFGLKTATPPLDYRRLFELAREFDLTTYDAAYLELADRLAVPLATRDEALLKAARLMNLNLD
jgi:predicted nucleic acid-binding protein